MQNNGIFWGHPDVKCKDKGRFNLPVLALVASSPKTGGWTKPSDRHGVVSDEMMLWLRSPYDREVIEHLFSVIKKVDDDVI